MAATVKLIVGNDEECNDEGVHKEVSSKKRQTSNTSF